MPALTDLIPIPASINPGLDGTSNKLMLSTLGNPRSSYSKECLGVTNAALKARMKTENFGPFKATGLDKAVASLKEVMADIKEEHPDIHKALGTAGMLCCRLVRGSATAISNHSWGTAIDLTLDGVLDKRGNDKVQFGLCVIAPIFNRHKWFWGAGFGTEDAMHFEVSKQLLLEWTSAAPQPAVKPVAVPDDLSVGDRGAKVVELQKKLNKDGETLDLDGLFGADTLAAVIAFQARHGLKPDGIVGAKSWAILNAL